MTGSVTPRRPDPCAVPVVVGPGKQLVGLVTLAELLRLLAGPPGTG